MISFVQFDTIPKEFSGPNIHSQKAVVRKSSGAIPQKPINRIAEISKKDSETINELKSRNREVKNHELAHRTFGRRFAGGSSFKYELGPDMKRYAVEGHTPIDTSEEIKPEKTIEKMRIVKRAALAPAKPSNNDRKIAMEAGYKKTKAVNELAENKRNNIQGLETMPLKTKSAFIDLMA